MKKMICSSTEFVEAFEKTLSDGGSVPIVVTGNSMNPFLVDGRDMVWLGACGKADFKKGKIILFKRSDGGLVLHRIRKILPNGELLMNGDAQNWCEKIKKDQAVAIVTAVERNNKKKNCGSKVVWQFLMPVRPLIMRIWRKARKYWSG